MKLKVNREIRCAKARIISKDGDQLGVMAIDNALLLAEDMKMDLVEISPNANPPVCKIIDYGKFRYSIAKKIKDNRKLSRKVKQKEIKLSLRIEDNDFRTKINSAADFIKKGYKVKFVCNLRGREAKLLSTAKELLGNVCKELKDTVVESPIQVAGRSVSMLISLDKGKNDKA